MSHPEEKDDFANVDLGPDNFGGDAHDGDFPEQEDDVPPRRTPSSSSKKSPLVRLASIGGIALLIVGGVGYAGYSYLSSTFMTPTVPHNVRHLPMAQNGNRAGIQTAQNQAAQFPGGNDTAGFPKTAQPAFPATPSQPGGFPAADQNAAQNLPALTKEAPSGAEAGAIHTDAPGGFPATADSQQKPNDPFGSAAPAAPVAALHGVQAPAGGEAAAPSDVPATAPLSGEHHESGDGMIAVLNSDAVKVLSSKADDNLTATKDAIKAGTDDVDAKIDATAKDLTARLDTIQASTTQMMARLDALSTNGLKAAHLGAPDSEDKDKAAKGKAAGGNALHHPAKHIRVTHPGKAEGKDTKKVTEGFAQPAGWHLRGFGNGFVVLQKDGHYTPVLIGKPLPDGSGIVEGIGKKDGKSIVKTSTGIIQE